MADIFSEFGGAALPAAESTQPADPFAAFGGQAIQPTAQPAQPEDPEMEAWLEGIAAVESGGVADPYKARNPKTTAVGKHQFIWSFWGEKSKHIKNFANNPNLTMEDFMNDPDLQERYVRYYYKDQVKNQAKGLAATYKNVLKARGIRDTNDVKAVLHFRGYDTTEQFLKTGIEPDTEGYNKTIKQYLETFRAAQDEAKKRYEKPAPTPTPTPAPQAAQAPQAPQEDEGPLAAFSTRQDYDKLKADLNKYVTLEDKKKLDRPIILGGFMDDVREKRVMPSEFEALARKHGVKAEDLKPWAAFFGTPAAQMTVTDTLLKEGWRFAVGELGEIILGGIPQKVMIETQKDPKMVAALDDLRTIAENKKGWVQRGAEIVGGLMTGTGLAKGAAKAASLAGAGKTAQAAAATATGLAEAAAFGAAQSERGKEVAGATVGLMFAGGLGAGVAVAKGLGKAADKVNKLRVKSSKALQDADPLLLERATAKAAEESAGVGSIFNTSIISNSSITGEDLRDARTLGEKLGKENVDAIYDYAVKTRPAKAEVVAENVRVKADELRRKIEDVQFRLESPRLAPENKAKLEDTLKSLQITLQKTDVDPKLAVVRSTVENLTRGLASDILGARISYKQTDPIAALRVYAKKPEVFKQDLDRYFIKQAVRRTIRAENYKAMPEQISTLKRIGDVVQASRFTAESIDRKYGTKVQPLLDSFGRLYNDMHSYILPRAKETSDLIKQTRAAGLAEGDDLFKALSTGQKTGDATKDAAIDGWRNLFDGVREDAGAFGLDIAYRKNYVPYKMKPMEEVFASLNKAVDDLRDRGITDLRAVRPDKETLDKLRKDDVGKQLLDSLDILSPGKGDYTTKLVSVLNDVKTGGINRVIAARGLQRGEEQLPALLQDTDVGRLAQHWIQSTFKAAVMRQPIAELRDMADLMKRIGDKNANKYLQNMVADLTGIPRDGGLGRELGQIKQRMAAYIQNKALNAKTPAARNVYSTIGAFTDSLPLMNTVMYGNALSGPRQLVNNISAVLTMTVPELGYVQGGKLVPKALIRTLNTVVRGEDIVVRNPQVAKRLGVNIGETVQVKSLKTILENEGMASGQRFENLEKAISTSLKKSVGREFTESGINKLSNLMLFLFESSETVMRHMTRDMGKQVAQAYAAKSKDAVRFADSLPRSYRKMLDEAKTPEQAEKIVTDYLIAKTVFNYNTASASEVSRSLGPMLSTFTKWPTEILGDTINTFEKNGITGGMVDLAYRRFAPLIALMTLDSVLNTEEMAKDDIGKYVIGRQGFKGMSPMNSLASVFEGEVAPPILKIGGKGAAAAATLDPEGALKVTKDALRLYAPSASLLNFIDSMLEE